MYEELVKRLRNCASSTWVEDCDGCPYIRYDGTYCINGLITQAADAIEELLTLKSLADAKIERLESAIPHQCGGKL